MIPYIFIAIVFFIGLISFANIQLGFSLIIASRILIPSNVRLQIGPGIQIYNAMTFIFIIAFLVYIIRKKKYKYEFKKEFINPFIVFFGGLLLLNLFAAELSVGQNLTQLFYTLINEFILSVFAFFIFNKISDINLFFKTIFITTVLVALYGIYNYLTLSNPYILVLLKVFPGMDALSFMQENRGGISGRIQSTQLHPLIWGGLCLLLYFLFRFCKMNKYLMAGIMFLLFLNIIFSGSRAAIISLIIGIVSLLIKNNYKQFIVKFLWGFGIFLVLLISLKNLDSLSKYYGVAEASFMFWDDDIAEKNNFSGSSYSLRMNQIEGSFDLIENAKFQGLGQAYIQDYQIRFGPHPVLMGFESLFFIALVSNGIIGLFLWIYIFYKLYRLLRRVDVKSNHKMEKYVIKVFFIIYMIFAIATGFQGVLCLFLVFYVIMIKYLIVRNQEIKVLQ